jgi:hypothetical protein
VDLRDADLARDLGLAPALEEGEVEKAALALVKRPKASGQNRAILADLVAVLDLLRVDRRSRRGRARLADVT